MKQRLSVQDVLVRLGRERLKVFSPTLFARLFKVNTQTARVFLSRNTARGHFIRLRKGFYSPKNLLPSAFEIANILYRPSYVSLDIALSYYHIIPEVVYSVTSITTKGTREFKILNQAYRYHKIDKNLFFGYTTIRSDNTRVVVASREKALLDYLYFVARGQKRFNTRFDLRTIDQKKLRQYASRFFRNVHNKLWTKRFGILLGQVEKLIKNKHA